ncbi:TonB-dependent receptor domain-containing protein, partial [Escherichia coli]
FKSDTLNNYEVGWKLSLPDRKLTLNGAAFIEEWKQLQFGLSGDNGITSIYNAGNARVHGVEASFAFASGGFELSGTGTYTDAKL